MKNFVPSNNKGFSGKELLATLIVIVILCAIAIPIFNALQDQRREHQVRDVIRVIQTAIEKKKISTPDTLEQKPYPQVLDDQPVGQPCHACFNAVFKRGISNPLWFKISDAEYAYSRNGDFGSAEKYTEKGDLRVIYNATSGKLTVEKR